MKRTRNHRSAGRGYKPVKFQEIRLAILGTSETSSRNASKKSFRLVLGGRFSVGYGYERVKFSVEILNFPCFV